MTKHDIITEQPQPGIGSKEPATVSIEIEELKEMRAMANFMITPVIPYLIRSDSINETFLKKVISCQVDKAREIVKRLNRHIG
jgi:hypothetical protein